MTSKETSRKLRDYHCRVKIEEVFEVFLYFYVTVLFANNGMAIVFGVFRRVGVGQLPLLILLLYIVIPHLEIRACDWSKLHHVADNKSR